MALARWALLKLRHHELDPRNWRPQILLFAGDPGKRAGLVRLASWFNQDRGVVTVCRLLVGDLERLRGDRGRMRDEMDRELEEAGVVAFPEVDVVPDFETGVLGVAQANGIAGLHSNTVMFGWSRRRSGSSPSSGSCVPCPTREEHHHHQAQLGPRAGQREAYRHLVGRPAEQRRPDAAARLPAAAQPRSGRERKDLSCDRWPATRRNAEQQLEGLAKLLPETRIGAETEVIVKPRRPHHHRGSARDQRQRRCRLPRDSRNLKRVEKPVTRIVSSSSPVASTRASSCGQAVSLPGCCFNRSFLVREHLAGRRDGATISSDLEGGALP